MDGRTVLRKGNFKMSFSVSVKEEICRHHSQSRHCQIAELLALVMTLGQIELREEQTRLFVKAENRLAADQVIWLLDKLFDHRIELAVHEHDLELSDEGQLKKVLMTLKLSDYIDYLEEDWLDEDELSQMEELLGADPITYVSAKGVSLQNCQFPRQVIRKECCKKAFIRGVFLAAGSVNDPKKAYHFEIALQNAEYAAVVKDVLCQFGLDAKLVKRKKYFVVYLKEGSMIVDALTIMEAYVGLMDMENVRILKDMRNDINRRVNCETANIKKTVDAARRQIEDIEYIERVKGLGYLKEPLRLLAEKRLEEPDANLAELGEMMDPPVSKSGVNHRLRKINNIAKALREDSQR